MRVRRPEERVSERSGGGWWLAIAGVALARITRRWRRLYRGGPWFFTEAQRMKVRETRHPDAAFEVAAACRGAADRASAGGYAEEAGALYVTAARLTHAAFALAKIMQVEPTFARGVRGAQLDAFEGLGAIRALPADDAAYWADRLAEAVAALFRCMVGDPFEGADQIKALLAIGNAAGVVQYLAPYRADAALRPLGVGHYHVGGVARITADLAHLELLGQLPESALARIELLLATTIAEPDDRLYALAVGLAAARGAGRMDLHAAWLEQIHAFIDASRESLRSFESRLYAMQAVVHQLRAAIEPEVTNGLHHVEDLLAIGEAVKARCLLDDLAGCGIAPTHPPPHAADAGKPATSAHAGARDELRDIAAPSGRRDADHREREKLSFWPLGPMGGIWSGAPAGYDVHGELTAQFVTSLTESDAQQVARHGGYAGGVRPATPAAIRAALAPDELLVELVIPRDPFSPNRTCWVLVVRTAGVAGQAIAVRHASAVQHLGEGGLIESGPLSDAAAAARAAILEGRDDDARDHLRWLFDVLIQPVLDLGIDPAQYRRWIVVPHGPLHLVPIPALVDPEGRHLIERVAITMVPSASVWLRMVERGTTRASRVLSVGNPALGARGAPLPDAEDEVRRIGDHLAWCPSPETLVGLDATEARVKAAMATAHVLHFATHGRLDLDNPRDGHALLFARDGVDDGLLRADEVRGMDLAHVGLVVLNACNGSVCRYGGGDEPLGLLAAFLCAGVANVLGGLWELSDRAAKAFILAFYDEFRDGDPAAALQAVARRAIRDAIPLAHWAGMTLVGPGRPLVVGGPESVAATGQGFAIS